MRLATTITALLAAVALAACGDDAAKVSSKEYVDQCKSEAGKKFKEQLPNITDKQVADFCQCTQDKLVDQGYGDRDVNDEELSKSKGTEIGAACASEVFVGSK